MGSWHGRVVRWFAGLLVLAGPRRRSRRRSAGAALVYEQHKGLPTSCFGDTEYFVVEVKPID